LPEKFWKWWFLLIALSGEKTWRGAQYSAALGYVILLRIDVLPEIPIGPKDFLLRLIDIGFARFARVMEFTYDAGLIALSIAAAILGSFTGLVMMSGIRWAYGAEAALRFGLGGLGIGGGVWSMHFIAMLAVVVPAKLTYSVPETLISAGLAVLFTVVALWVVAYQKFGSFSLPSSALFLGCGIGVMHYLGMQAIRGCSLQYSPLSMALAILIAVQASAVALWFTFRMRGVLDTFLGSIALGLAVASMHYAAMEGTRFLPVWGPAPLANVFKESTLAVSVAITLYTICSVCLIVFAVLTFSRRPVRL
jgi:diguanylate cyclase